MLEPLTYSPPLQVITWGEEPPEYWYLTLGAFYDRFAEKKLQILACLDPIVQACIKDVAARQYVDLKHPDVLKAIPYMVSLGLLTQEFATVILTAPTTPEERWLKGLPQPIEATT